MTEVVSAYLDAIVTHDWAALRDCVAEDVVRVGPFGDTYTGRDDYVEFISALMPTLPGYAMEVSRLTQSGDRVFVELSETVEVDGTPTVTREVLAVDTRGNRISRIEIYIQRAPS